jgi:hypothetical protein
MLRLSFIFTLLGSVALADSSSLNLALPQVAPNYQSDRFRAGELDCSNAIGSATQFETGVTGLIAKNDPIMGGNQVGDIGVYARIVIPLGKRVKSRVDCNRLYELELRKKELEVMKLEQELKALRKLQFEN